MKKTLLVASLLLLAGCATEPGISDDKHLKNLKTLCYSETIKMTHTERNEWCNDLEIEIIRQQSKTHRYSSIETERVSSPQSSADDQDGYSFLTSSYNSDGSYSRRSGDSIYNSDGSYSRVSGSTMYNSDGSYSRRTGNTIYNSDGSYSRVGY